MAEKMYKLSTILQFIEKNYENVLTNRKMREIKKRLDDLE